MGEQAYSDYPAWAAPRGVRLVVVEERPCPYLPGRASQVRAMAARRLPAGLFTDLLNAGFRRSGTIIYQPVCRGCRECTPIRVPVARFAPSKSQRRVMRRNADLRVSVAAPSLTGDAEELYRRYLRDWHGRADPADAQGLGEFLYTSPATSLEFRYHDPAGRLLAVGICDVGVDVLSSVYFYFDPADADRRLGTLGAMTEISYARTAGLAYYHLGYWVQGCGAMAYKASFRPFEVLRTDGTWAPPLERGHQSP